MAETVQIATLKRALEIAGDIAELSTRVGSGVESLRAMLRGEVAIENWVFLRAVNYINRELAELHRVQSFDYHDGPDTRQ